MHRFFVDKDKIDGENVLIDADDIPHILRVLRLKAGDEILVCDGNGMQSEAKICDLTPKKITAQCVDWKALNTEPATRITMYQSLPKSGKLDMILQKGTEVGISSFGLFASKRSVVQGGNQGGNIKRDRYAKIVREAARQSNRAIIPRVFAVESHKSRGIGSSGDLANILHLHQKTLIAYEMEKNNDIDSAISFLKNSNDVDIVESHKDRTATSIVEPLKNSHYANVNDIAIIIGPEGGFSNEEADCFISAGAYPVSLGPRILRTETAGTCFAAILLFALGDMKPRV